MPSCVYCLDILCVIYMSDFNSHPRNKSKTINVYLKDVLQQRGKKKERNWSLHLNNEVELTEQILFSVMGRQCHRFTVRHKGYMQEKEEQMNTILVYFIFLLKTLTCK